MASRQQDRAELDRRAREGQTVVPGGTGGKSLEAQEHLAEGRSIIKSFNVIIIKLCSSSSSLCVEVVNREAQGRTDAERSAGDGRVSGDGTQRRAEHRRRVGRGTRRP